MCYVFSTFNVFHPLTTQKNNVGFRVIVVDDDVGGVVFRLGPVRGGDGRLVDGGVVTVAALADLYFFLGGFLVAMCAFLAIPSGALFWTA